mgnify:CR=1 FL=1
MRRVKEERTRPIGIFDSGVGGVSVVRAIRRELPHETLLYFGDTANAPYGTKPVDEVLACVEQVMARFIKADVKAVVIACNTATSVAAETLRKEYALPIIGMEPAVKPAHELRHGGRVLVLATPVTLSLPKFRRLMERYGEGVEPLPCPGLMELVERGCLEGEEIEHDLTRRLAPYDMTQVDAVVLGCTHYVFLRPTLRRMLPTHTAILDGNEGTARQLRHVLAARGALASETAEGSVTFDTSGDKAAVVPLMEKLATVPLDGV